MPLLRQGLLRAVQELTPPHHDDHDEEEAEGGELAPAAFDLAAAIERAAQADEEGIAEADAEVAAVPVQRQRICSALRDAMLTEDAMLRECALALAELNGYSALARPKQGGLAAFKAMLPAAARRCRRSASPPATSCTTR